MMLITSPQFGHLLDREDVVGLLFADLPDIPKASPPNHLQKLEVTFGRNF